MGRLDDTVAIGDGREPGHRPGHRACSAKEGAAVTVAARTAPKLRAVADEILDAGGRGLAVPSDVDRDAVLLVATTVANVAQLDVLVNNAQGVPPNRRLQDAPPEDPELAWATGPMATLHGMQAAFPHLSERGGSIVNFGSNTAIEGSPLFSAYAMAKEAIRGLSRVAAWNGAGSGSGRTSSVPSPVAGSRGVQQRTSGGRGRDPQVDPARPRSDAEDDIGRAVVALVGPDMDYITGATLMILRRPQHHPRRSGRRPAAGARAAAGLRHARPLRFSSV